MSFISLNQAFTQWQKLARDIDKDDGPALAESWNDYTDSLAKDGQLCALQYHYCPAYDEPMPAEGSRYDELSEDRALILEAMGVALACNFVPFSASRNSKGKHPSLNWKVTLSVRGRDIMTTDYSQGSAHCPAYKSPSVFASGKRDEHTTRLRIAAECETGRAHLAANNWSTLLLPKGAIEGPDVVDVLHSLLLDASAADEGSFENWAASLGYDTDSRTAEATYAACVDTFLKLRAAFGDKTLSELRELFEGM